LFRAWSLEQAMSENQLRSKPTALKDIEQSYDEFPYPNRCFAQTHPDRLQTIAKLFGVAVANPETARILEIGCASGGNILPMAEQLPDAEFVGFDLSGNQIAQGQKIVDALSLRNIQLRQMDILDLDHQLGKFDYIICHGVYSWVPEAVQKKILEVLQGHLNPQGVGYVSFNTFPGWHFRGMIRDMMRYHVRNIESPTESVAQARALLAFLAKNATSEESAYGMLLRGELESLQHQDDGYLYHEHLEQFNQPIYFHQFMESLSQFSLQYLGDSSISSMWIENFPQETSARLKKLTPDILQREQYSDFLRNRTFRQALVVHNDVHIDRDLTAERIADALVIGHLTEDEQASAELIPDTSFTLVEKRSKRNVKSSDPVLKAAAVHLSNQWPAAISVQELYETSQKNLRREHNLDQNQMDREKANFQNQMIQLFISGLIHLKYAPDRYLYEVTTFPSMTPLARYQAAQGRITNRRHESIALDKITARVCQMADGKTDRKAMLGQLRTLVQNGELKLQADGKAIGDVSGDQLDAILLRLVDQKLDWLCSRALLV